MTATTTTSTFHEWTSDIERARSKLGIQGLSVAVVHQDKTLSHIGSLTKAFTAAAVGELVAENKAKWDVPVSEYLPEFQLKDPCLTKEITFIDLLSHRTGYPSLDLEWWLRPESRLELIKLLRHVDPQAPVRSDFIYNNYMYAAAGEAASRIAGTSYEDVILEKLLYPLGMKDSGFTLAEMMRRPNHALSYHCKSFESAQKGETYRLVVDGIPESLIPAGDIYSNVLDMARWARAMMHDGCLDGEHVLHKETVEKMTTAWNLISRRLSLTDTSINACGLGWGITHYKGRQKWGHEGGSPGYRSSIALFPHDDLAVICLANSSISELVSWIPRYIADRVLSLPVTKDWLFDVAVEETRDEYKNSDPAEEEKRLPPQVNDKPTTRELKDFVGEYTHPYAAPFAIQTLTDEQGNDSLAFKIFHYEGTLAHYHYDSFRLQVVDVNIPMIALLTFIAGDNGSIQQCRMLIDDRTHLSRIYLPSSAGFLVSGFLRPVDIFCVDTMTSTVVGGMLRLKIMFPNERRQDKSVNKDVFISSRPDLALFPVDAYNRERFSQFPLRLKHPKFPTTFITLSYVS
ncbi:hypothetical protein BGZ93_008282 [Podila epicladia]|nr:hypothetical protein BGZ92_008016 [Podila epicladia]KAG0092536.1 hypothetical protein BGZ93_008282 [Podila epicladia]